MSGDGCPILITIFHSSVVPLNRSGPREPSRVSNTTVKCCCFVMLMFYGEGNGEVLLRALCIAMVTNVLKH